VLIVKVGVTLSPLSVSKSTLSSLPIPAEEAEGIGEEGRGGGGGKGE